MKKQLLLLPVLTVSLTAMAAPRHATPAPASNVTVNQTATQLMRLTQDARCKQVLATCLIAGQPLRVILDTGATHTVLHTASAKQLKQVSWIDTSNINFRGNAAQRPELLSAPLQIGPKTFAPRPFLVLDLSGVRSMMTEPIDGIVGMDILNQLPFTFDFANQRFEWRAFAGKRLPVEGSREQSGRQHLSVTSGEHAFSLLLDTGSSVTRVAEKDWTPGVGEAVNANVSDVNAAAAIQTRTGKPGTLRLTQHLTTPTLAPHLCAPGERTVLGVDALEGLLLIHHPGDANTLGQFFLTPVPKR